MSSLVSMVGFILILGVVAFFGIRTSVLPTAPLPVDEQGEVRESPDSDGILSVIDSAKDAKQRIESRSEVSDTKTTLDLSGQGLTKVSMDVFGRTELTVLNVSHNALTGALPAEVRHLKNLVTLDMSYNALTGVPAEVGQLEKLEVLNLSNNKLTGLPYELGNLKNLKVLDLRGNAYSEVDLGVIKKSLPQTAVILTE